GYGCWGGYHGGCDCACMGGGYYGGAGCWGGMAPMAPPMKPEDKKPEDKKPEDKKPVGEISAPATLIVNLPAEAKLLVDGNITKSTSAERVFVSPALIPGQLYNYP